MGRLLTSEEFNHIISQLAPSSVSVRSEYLYDIYQDVYQGLLRRRRDRGQ